MYIRRHDETQEFLKLSTPDPFLRLLSEFSTKKQRDPRRPDPEVGIAGSNV